MDKEHVKALIARHLPQAGLLKTQIQGVELFHVDAPVPCVPAVYDPTIIAILSGAKEAVLGGERHIYDASKYLLSPMTMPVEAGAPHASADAPLLGVKITLDARVMTKLTIALESTAGAIRRPEKSAPQGLSLAGWDQGFTRALLQLVELLENPVDMAVLGPGRLRELYYAVLQGDAMFAARRAFGVGREIAQTIDYVSTRLNTPVTIDDMAAQVGMSRAVFHRRFKQATTMSPIQFVKSMRLNNAAMKIAGGMNVSEAAWDVGYQSASQFSRDFKRMYGQSPRQWGNETRIPVGLM